MKIIRLLVAAVALLALTAPASARAQEPVRTRQGFWLNAGLGWGSSDCEACDDGKVGGGVGVLAVGGSLSQKVLLGASSNVWVRDEGDVTKTLGALTAVVRFYPARAGNYFLLAGLGISTRSIETETVAGTLSVSDNGTAAIVGGGYDFRIARNISLTPFANAIGVDFDGEGSGFTQLGLSVTVH